LAQIRVIEDDGGGGDVGTRKTGHDLERPHPVDYSASGWFDYLGSRAV
jgi:hypothetical protein